ncbi:hypothetical protein [Nocardia sp. alder85J]|uniref:hypothetical protein n=1 Tax=Nocardia sp. alder85J TaxID=2862949 RepID=UPI001CD3B125|nr:hypothetical protein [Nocardia sp. alder85J]MCX4092761.1 hypothetical protein [Nocardia sp. alder85J]
MNAAELDDSYRWETTYTEADGATRIDSGTGRFGRTDALTGRVCRTFVEVATALFDLQCDEVTEGHYYDVLDARIEGRPDPELPMRRVALLVRDGSGAEKVSMAADLTYRPVTGEALDHYREQLAEWERRDTARRSRRARASARQSPGPKAVSVDSGLRQVVAALRTEADGIRDEIFTPDHCREQLALAESAVAAALGAERAARDRGEEAEAAYARAYVKRWKPRVDRWASMLELTLEAYMDADAVDTLADRIANLPMPPGTEPDTENRSA